MFIIVTIHYILSDTLVLIMLMIIGTITMFNILINNFIGLCYLTMPLHLTVGILSASSMPNLNVSYILWPIICDRLKQSHNKECD